MSASYTLFREFSSNPIQLSRSFPFCNGKSSFVIFIVSSCLRCDSLHSLNACDHVIFDLFIVSTEESNFEIGDDHPIILIAGLRGPLN